MNPKKHQIDCEQNIIHSLDLLASLLLRGGPFVSRQKNGNDIFQITNPKGMTLFFFERPNPEGMTLFYSPNGFN